MNDLPPSSRKGSRLPDATKLETSIAALPELSLRVPWLREFLEKTAPEVAFSALDPILENALTGSARARDVTLAFALYLAESHEKSSLGRLRNSVDRTKTPNVERMLREAGEDAPEIELEIPVPVYSKERELSVGERRSLARRPTRLQIEKLLLDPSPLVISQLFSSPTLVEEDVLRLITKRPARIFALGQLTTHMRWMARRRIRFALVQNPGTPGRIAVPLVPTLPREDLVSILQNTTLSGTIRKSALELVERIPPLSSPGDEPSWQ